MMADRIRMGLPRFPAGLLLAAFLLSSLPAPARTNLKPEPYYGAIAKTLAKRFPKEHLTRSSLDETISSRMWTNYFATLDYERVYFLASDIAAFRVHELTLSDELQEGNLDFAYQVFDTLRDRVRERVQYVQKLLAEGFDVEKDETYRWQRKDSPWAADKAELNEIWRKRIKNEYVRQLVAQASTNQVDQTGAEKKPEARSPKDEPAVTPAESIRKRYQQLLTMLDDTDADWVLERYLTAFTHAFDPHSDYMSPSAVEDFNIEMKLSLFGIGALLTAEDGAAKVVRLIPGGPADRDKRDQRLRPGDKIIEVASGEGKPVDILHWPLQKIVKLIRGEKGTTVMLTVVPASDPTGTTTKKVDLQRDEVKLEEQAASSKIHEVQGTSGVALKLGVITLPAFYGDMKAMSQNETDFKSSTRDVEDILTRIRKDVDGVILDLRNNGGGSLLEAIRMTGLFISAGPVVQVRERSHIRVLSDTDPRVMYSGPLLVLVNRLSASASEIVAGALQDYGRGVLVGDSKTHGKGTVQSMLEVGREEKLGSVKITTASYYRISGASTQLKGITPDIIIPSPFDFMQLGEESLPNPLEWSRIDPARFAPVSDERPLIAELRKKFEARRAADSRYAVYTQFLARVEAINKTEEVPLNLQKRMALARTEKEIADLQNQIAPDGETSTNNTANARPDIVLDESLRILADMVSPQERPQPQPASSPQAEADGKSVAQAVFEWLHDHL